MAVPVCRGSSTSMRVVVISLEAARGVGSEWGYWESCWVVFLRGRGWTSSWCWSSVLGSGASGVFLRIRIALIAFIIAEATRDCC